MPANDRIVVGASSGGIEALIQLVKSLPADLPATLFVVVHFPPDSYSMLPKILSRNGPLRAVHAKEGEPIRAGMIYIAPPNQHLTLGDETIHLDQGPRQNGFRPSIDALFTSAAQVYASRVVGVLLSGGLSDGVSGLRKIQRAGGVTLVQDPEEALLPSLPLNAIQGGTADYVLPVAMIAERISQLALEGVAMEGNDQMVERSENEIVQQEIRTYEEGGKLQTATMFTCPDCGGVMWEIQDGNLIKYRCHVGHVYSSENYLAEQAEALEFALWASVRSLEERATILRRLAKMAGQSSGSRTAQLYEQQAQENEVNAKIIRNLLLSRNTEAADISKIPRHKMTSASHAPANTPGED